MEVGVADDWSHLWEDLPVYEGGTKIVYSVEETIPAGSEYTLESIVPASVTAVKDGKERRKDLG